MMYRNDIFRFDIINMLIQKYDFKSYLEIGVEYGDMFKLIQCETKVSVDPEQYGYTTNQQTSDEFFNSLNESIKFDIIFIDGLHICNQCYKDIINSVNHLSNNGFILCHDMNPENEFLCRSYEEFLQNPVQWTGDVYKSFIKFRQNYQNYSSCLLYDCDYGIGVITKGIGQQICNIDVDNLTFKQWEVNKNYLMNCIDTDTFMKNFC